jgi:hypothetical protein
MEILYRVTSDEFGVVILRSRRIAKALRWWLRENKIEYTYNFFLN